MNDQNDTISKMKRLRSRQEEEDDVQAAYLIQWGIDHPHADRTGYLLLILVGIIAVIAITAYIRRLPQPLTLSVGCRECHVTEVIKYRTLNQYKAGLRLAAGNGR